MPKAKKLKTPLSSDLSTAIRQAAGDVMAVRRDSRYSIYMEAWHRPGDVGKCSVCMAGAAMVCRFDFEDPSCSISAADSRFSDSDTSMFIALNNIRCGNVKRAARLTGLRVTRNPPRYVTYPVKYREERAGEWYVNMLRVSVWVGENTKKEGDP